MVLLCAAWGVGQVAMKVGGEGISPLAHAGLRSIGSLALLWLWCRARGVPIVPPEGARAAAALCGALFAGEFVLVYTGLTYTTAARGVVFLYTAPCLITLLAHLLLPNDRLTRGKAAGLGLCLVALMLAFGDSLRLPSGREAIGDLLCLAGAMAWGATTITIKATRLRFAPAEATLASQLAVSALLLPLGLALGEPGIFDPSPLILGVLGFEIVLVAFGSYLAWFWLITRYRVSGLAALSFLTPVFGVLAGAVLLGEAVTLPLVTALVLICVGIWLVNRPA
ncbi:drug/metabolite transporter (DMT)-like permease [Humitalea rosea]|uniref:Drug/metabolite transporter (DMT)-like permease n=1 Tax=Humitalea rosea TaxID=990373 RepID=A0A2W7IRP7_9PROT|nr:DMT family transporter [Humitalea rosea]PZW49106.1 drug/metabolite transporter (DMT)-like permease [Humitalea rosea]